MWFPKQLTGRLCGRKQAWPALVLLASIGTAVLLSAQLYGQADTPVQRSDSESETKSQELMRLQDQLRRRSEAALQRRREQQDRLDALRAELNAGRRRNDAIQREIDQRKSRLEEISAQTAEAMTKDERIADEEQKLKDRTEQFLSSLQRRVESGIPWKISERVHAIQEAVTLIGDQRTNAASALATAGRLLRDQEALGRLIESSILEIETPDGPKAVSGVHLGLIGVIFASDDGTLLGFSGAGESLEAGLSAVDGRPEAAKGYLHTVDILNRRRTPQLVDLLLPKLPVEEGGSR